MLLVSAGAPVLRVSRRRTVRALVVIATLAAGVVSCGRDDPSKPIQKLQSAAETARLTLGERRDGAVSERYAVGMLDVLATKLPTIRTSLERAALAEPLRTRALASADELRGALDDARRQAAARAAAEARLAALAESLDTLARAAGAKGG